jgi:enterochelin esterase-like enzyme
MPIHPLLAKARLQGNPIIEDGVATLVWHGATPPLLIDDLHNWDESPQKLLRLSSRLWTFPLSLPSNAYIEYAFLNRRTGERIPDPLNPRRIWNGINAYNHYFYMPNGGPTPLIHPGKVISRGMVIRYALPTREYIMGAERNVYLYQPPVETPVPLLVVYDGPDYLHRGRLNVTVDNLIGEKRIRPIALAMVQNGRKARTIEYSCGESTLGFLMECVLPLAREHLNLEPSENGNYGIMGASLGGSMALFTALCLPQIFRKVLAQSGAFIAADYQSVVVDLVRYLPPPDIDIWMDVGQFESLLDDNRQMFALLKEKEYRVKYREFPGGHNYTSWRNDLGSGLEGLYSRK